MNKPKGQSDAHESEYQPKHLPLDSPGVMAERDTDEQEPESNDPDYYCEDQIDRIASQFVTWLRDKNTGPHEWLVALATVVLMFVSCVQLAVSCSNSAQTDKIIEASRKNAQAADRFATAAEGIQGGVSDAVAKLSIQAGAAKSAAFTAKQTLQVSERAYLKLEDPTIDIQAKSVTLPVFNSGQLPSGEATATVHSATYVAASLGGGVDWNQPADKAWQRMHWSSVAQGNHDSVIVPFPVLDEKQYNSGLEGVVIAGDITYNNGFAGTPQQTSKFCFRSLYHLVLKKPLLAQCDPEDIIPRLEKIDGYPNNEHHD
jgi:hypothetical protein